MTTWEPGDVAMRTYLVGPPKRSLYVSRCNIECHQDGPHWHHQDGGWDMRDGNPSYRPLVVLDPEDRAAARRLVGLLVTETRLAMPGTSSEWDDGVQAALREFANPKPPEPQGLGAVVEDAEGQRYVRHPAEGTGCKPWCNSIGVGRSWAQVDAVRVLSEGVQP